MRAMLVDKVRNHEAKPDSLADFIDEESFFIVLFTDVTS